MQRTFLSPSTLRAGALACAALLTAPAPATAAELGDVAVRSFVGQQLAADIELVGLSPDEMNGLPVRLASADVYSGANLTPDPVLASLRLSVVKRDQRWFLHMTTLRPVDANHLYLYLELGSGEHQVVREATVWLAPDPHPAPPPSPVVMAAAELPVQAAPAASPKPVVKVAPKAPPALAQDAAPKATPAAMEPAPRASADAARPDAALIAAIARVRHPPAPVRAAPSGSPVHAGDAAADPSASKTAKPSADGDGQAQPPAAKAAHAATPPYALAGPSAATHDASASKEAAPHAASAARPAAVHEAMTRSALPAGSAEVAPASCPVKPLRMAARECIVLDSHSIVISSKIDELEDKVRVLQTALAGPPPRLAPPAAGASAPPAARAAGHASLSKLKYRDKKEKPVEHGPTTALLIGAGVAALALVAGLLFWLRKRKAKKGGGPLKIWQSWRKKGARASETALPEAKPEELMEPQ